MSPRSVLTDYCCAGCIINNNMPQMSPFKMLNTHDQIYYNNNISNPGGHMQKGIQFKHVVYQMG